jgi:hypothetical protein
MNEDLDRNELRMESFQGLETDLRESETEEQHWAESLNEGEMKADEYLAKIRHKHDELEETQGLATAEYQANLIDSINKLSPIALHEALEKVEPSKAGIVWQILEDKRAD